jgi:hypothetical protein
MNFGEYLKAGFRAVALDAKAMKRIAADSAKIPHALILSVLLALLSVGLHVLATFVHDPSIFQEDLLGFLIFDVLIGFVVVLAAQFIAIGIVHLLAKLFGGKASFFSLFAVCVFVSVLSIPIDVLQAVTRSELLLTILGWLLGAVYAYVLVVTIFAVRTVHSVATWKAVISVVVPVVLLLLALITLYYLLITGSAVQPAL